MNITKKGAVRAAVTTLLVSVTALTLALAVPAAAQPGSQSGRIFENTPPIAENLEYGTFKAVPITGMFSATDPDGDAVTFEVITPPKRGSVEHDG
ncbi:MAG: hypothetical protein LBJ99_04290, partial [Oscillospiraceae bacterium]|nr:hypothetical protein [Oscillospiraceae bacterium]